jgi:hypothetical protein
VFCGAVVFLDCGYDWQEKRRTDTDGGGLCGRGVLCQAESRLENRRSELNPNLKGGFATGSFRQMPAFVGANACRPVFF